METECKLSVAVHAYCMHACKKLGKLVVFNYNKVHVIC